eukprot:3336283-Alexandrium_andersonii.AAC.1
MCIRDSNNTASPAPCIDPQSQPPFSKRPWGRPSSTGGGATNRNARPNSRKGARAERRWRRPKPE